MSNGHGRSKRHLKTCFWCRLEKRGDDFLHFILHSVVVLGCAAAIIAVIVSAITGGH